MNRLAEDFILSCLNGLLADEGALLRTLRNGTFAFPIKVSRLEDFEIGRIGDRQNLSDVLGNVPELLRQRDLYFLLIDPFFEAEASARSSERFDIYRNDIPCACYLYEKGRSLEGVSNDFARLHSFNAFCFTGSSATISSGPPSLEEIFQWSTAFWVRAFDEMDFVFWKRSFRLR